MQSYAEQQAGEIVYGDQGKKAIRNAEDQYVLRAQITAAIGTAYREGAEKMREKVEQKIKLLRLDVRELDITPPQPAAQAESPRHVTQQESEVLHKALLKSSELVDEGHLVDDERKMRKAFEEWLCDLYEPLSAESVAAQWDGERYESTVMDAQWEAYQAAWKEKSK